MTMLHFDWSVCMFLKLGRPMFAMWFDSNSVEMTTVEHDFMKLFEMFACYCYSFRELKFMLTIYTFI